MVALKRSARSSRPTARTRPLSLAAVTNTTPAVLALPAPSPPSPVASAGAANAVILNASTPAPDDILMAVLSLPPPALVPLRRS